LFCSVDAVHEPCKIAVWIRAVIPDPHVVVVRICFYLI
jgi:hypothetical protein